MAGEKQIAEQLVHKVAPALYARLLMVGGGHDAFERFEMDLTYSGNEMKAVVTVELKTPFSPRVVVVG